MLRAEACFELIFIFLVVYGALAVETLAPIGCGAFWPGVYLLLRKNMVVFLKVTAFRNTR